MEFELHLLCVAASKFSPEIVTENRPVSRFFPPKKMDVIMNASAHISTSLHVFTQAGRRVVATQAGYTIQTGGLYKRKCISSGQPLLPFQKVFFFFFSPRIIASPLKQFAATLQVSGKAVTAVHEAAVH